MVGDLMRIGSHSSMFTLTHTVGEGEREKSDKMRKKMQQQKSERGRVYTEIAIKKNTVWREIIHLLLWLFLRFTIGTHTSLYHYTSSSIFRRYLCLSLTFDSWMSFSHAMAITRSQVFCSFILFFLLFISHKPIQYCPVLWKWEIACIGRCISFSYMAFCNRWCCCYCIVLCSWFSCGWVGGRKYIMCQRDGWANA